MLCIIGQTSGWDLDGKESRSVGGDVDGGAAKLRVGAHVLLSVLLFYQ